MRQLVYTMFINNNRVLFHLWWKENLSKHQKVSRYYERGCPKNFLWLFMSLLTAPIDKNSHIQARIYIIFIKKFLKQTWKSFNTNFWPQSKNWKSSYKVRQIFTLSWYLIALILGQNCVKGFRVTNIVKEIKLERAWRELEVFETNSSFHVK